MRRPLGLKWRFEQKDFRRASIVANISEDCTDVSDNFPKIVDSISFICEEVLKIFRYGTLKG